jgi:hypothetical protein
VRVGGERRVAAAAERRARSEREKEASEKALAPSTPKYM